MRKEGWFNGKIDGFLYLYLSLTTHYSQEIFIEISSCKQIIYKKTMNLYKLSKGWTFFLVIVLVPLTGLLGYALLMPLIPGKENFFTGNNYWYLAPVFLGLIGLVIALLVDVFIGKFVIDQDKLYTSGIFYNRQLFFDEIKGYRTEENYIIIESNLSTKKRVLISRYYARDYDIIEWLDDRYPNLDFLEQETSAMEILEDEAFGSTEEEKELNLKRAHKAAKILNWGGFVIGLWTFFYPFPYDYIVPVCMTVPLIALLALRLFKGRIKIGGKKNSVYPNLYMAWLMPIMALFLRALQDFEIFDYSTVWEPLGVVAAVLGILLVAGNKDFKFKEIMDYVMLGIFTLFLCLYGYGVVVLTNCQYDDSEPELFQAEILSKRITSGKNTTRYFELTPWGPKKEAEEVQVHNALYKQFETGDSVTVYYGKGRFNIPYYLVLGE